MFASTLAILASVPGTALAECIGEGDYRVCTDSYTDSSGDSHVTSSDTMGNSYSVDTTTRRLSGGGTEIKSSDTMGNSYSVKSWSDAAGSHSVDSMGNECTITTAGKMIGCGQ